MSKSPQEARMGALERGEDEQWRWLSLVSYDLREGWGVITRLPGTRFLVDCTKSYWQFQLQVSIIPYPDAPCMVYLPTKLGHLWGECR